MGTIALAAITATTRITPGDLLQISQNTEVAPGTPSGMATTRVSLNPNSHRSPSPFITNAIDPYLREVAWQLFATGENASQTNCPASQCCPSALSGLEPRAPQFTGMVVEIQGQAAYVAVPSILDTQNPPKIVIYHHGSNTRVTAGLDNDFMRNLAAYAGIFTAHNFIFCASNAHGENWGNIESIRDNLNMVNWVRENYPTASDIYMIGFSMGGLTALRFARYHPENIKKIALLAPRTTLFDWDSQTIQILDHVDLLIWHGDADQNIPVSNSIRFVGHMRNLGKNIPLITLSGKSHFDVETGYSHNILFFFINKPQLYNRPKLIAQ